MGLDPELQSEPGESFDSQAHICAPPTNHQPYHKDFVFCFIKPGDPIQRLKDEAAFLYQSEAGRGGLPTSWAAFPIRGWSRTFPVAHRAARICANMPILIHREVRSWLR